MEITPEIKERLEKLSEKFTAMGQDMVSYLDGLLYANYLTYWDYIHLDTLLSLQTPRTDFPDEVIFIGYHQITEIYFKLIRHELDQIIEVHPQDAQQWKKRIRRVTNYFKNLTDSFDIMVEGMDREQFLQFRMTLLPASGFQSGQFRMVEFMCTGIRNLVKDEVRDEVPADASIDDMYEKIHWKYGNIELSSGKKTLTLTMFEKKYDPILKGMAEDYWNKNLNVLYRELTPDEQEMLKDEMRDLDLYANIYWPLSHLKSAAKYLYRNPEVIKATGGTNWQKFLPPQFKRVSFFPDLWTKQELDEWGKEWVQELFREKVQKQWKKMEDDT